jgi:hypothetical protein
MVSAICSSWVRTRISGRPGSTVRIAARTAAVMASASPAVRTSTVIRRGGVCVYGMKKVGGAGSLSREYFASRTTPTTSIGMFRSGPLTNANRRPQRAKVR